MTQRRRMSILETVASTAIGYGISVVMNALILPLYGIRIPLSADFSIAALFTIASLIRGYVLRRAFNRFGRV